MSPAGSLKITGGNWLPKEKKSKKEMEVKLKEERRQKREREREEEQKEKERRRVQRDEERAKRKETEERKKEQKRQREESKREKQRGRSTRQSKKRRWSDTYICPACEGAYDDDDCEQITWIECSSCSQWFHLSCTQLDTAARDLDSIDFFAKIACNLCTLILVSLAIPFT